MKKESTLLISTLIFSVGSLAEVAPGRITYKPYGSNEPSVYCEDKKPYTEKRRRDPTCHDTSNPIGTNKLSDINGAVGGGGCGKNSVCGENSNERTETVKSQKTQIHGYGDDIH